MKNTYKIPEGCTSISIEQIGNKIVTEFETGFSRGDVVISKQNWMCIYKHSGCYYLGLSQNTNKLDLIESTCPTIRLATQSEKQLLFNALAEAGKQWNAEALQIEDLKVEPKVGDCVKARYADKFFFGIFKGDSTTKRVGTVDGVGNGRFKTYDSIEILTPSKFQSEVNALGFEYDFNNDTFKELRWEPKKGDNYWHITTEFKAVELCNDDVAYDERKINAGNFFKTKSECESVIEKIKNVLKSK